MPLSRRQLLKVFGISFFNGLLLPAKGYAKQNNPLPIPPLLESTRGQPLFLSLQRCQWQFFPGERLTVWGFNGLHLGPTIRISRGDYAKIICSNQLDQPVSLTFSGLNLPASVIGNVNRIMTPQSDWSPVLPVRQPAATCWYHANTPGLMGKQVYNGLAGMCIINDDDPVQLLFPKRYGIDDIPVIIQDKAFTFSKELVYNPENNGFIGDTLLTNGIFSPQVKVPAGWVRLRLLNASNARRYELKLSTNEAFVIIASDQGILDKPLVVQQVTLAPGERREILIKMIANKQVSLITNNQTMLMGRLGITFDKSDKLISNKVITLIANENSNYLAEPLPATFYKKSMLPEVTNPHPRVIKLNYPAAINGAVWDNKRIDIRVKVGDVEHWIIQAEKPQSFYVQGAIFWIKSRNGNPPTVDDAGWKDTVWVEGQVEILIRFIQFSSEKYPFLFGSQTLEYADRGAIGQMEISNS